MRIIGLLRADTASEAGVLPTPGEMEAIGKFMQEAGEAGVLLGGEGLKPTSVSKRVVVREGQTTVIDGPFAESKELIASYAMLQVNDWDEAIYWTSRFLEVVGGGESELRPIWEPEDFAQ